MSSTTVYMTHMLRKISRAVKSMGKETDQDNAPINSAAHYQSFYFGLSLNQHQVPLSDWEQNKGGGFLLFIYDVF